MDTPFIQAFNFIVSCWRWVLRTLDSIVLFGNTTVLDLNIVLVIFTIAFTVVFVTIKSGSVSFADVGSRGVAAARNSYRSSQRDKAKSLEKRELDNFANDYYNSF